jgi:large subunit ribosomal protein L10
METQPGLCRGESQSKDFFVYKGREKSLNIIYILKKEGGESSLAFTKDQKSAIIKQYDQWIADSQAIFMLEYNKMSMKEIDALRAKARDNGAEVHVVKNTLFGIALANAGYDTSKLLEKTTLVGFAFKDAPALAKVFGEVTKNSEVFMVKGGYLDKHAIKPEQVKALADLPPLPVMRARLLGVLVAPASQLVRTLAEPARSVASVFKAYSEKGAGDTAVGDTAAIPAAA